MRAYVKKWAELDDPIRHLVTGLSLFAVLIGAVGIRVVAQAATGPEQPLSITACEPDDYPTNLALVEGSTPGNQEYERGPDQTDCERAYPPDGIVFIGQDIPVSGQVCNDSDEAIPYHVLVALLAVDGSARFPLVDVGVTYDPGCRRPYTEFAWKFPEAFTALVNPDVTGDYGRWRIVGLATPLDQAKYQPYQWDSVQTFSIQAPPQP